MYRILDNSINEDWLSAPLKVFIEVTSQCNMTCKHCLNDSNNAGKETDISIDEWIIILNELSRIGVFEIKFTGGEPFYREDFMSIVKKAIELGFVVTIATNGSLITKSIAKDLSKMPLKAVRISLDGPEEINDYIRGAGSFKKALHGFHLLKANNVNTGFSMTLNSYNYSYIEETLQIALKNGTSLFNIGTIKPSGRSLKNKDLLEDSKKIIQTISNLDLTPYKDMKINLPFIPKEGMILNDEPFFIDRFGCIAGQSSCNIDSTGKVSPCGILGAYDKVFIGGKLPEDCFLDIWNNSSPFKVLRTLTGNEQCNSCKYFCKLCNGGCRARALIMSGDLNSQDIFCPLY